MDTLDNDLLRFWKSMNDHSVKYIMVGGFAVRFQGFNRSTDDIDLWLKDTLENRKKLRTAFQSLGYGDFPELEKMEFIAGWSDFIITSGVRVDIMTKMKGLEKISFDECYSMASQATIEGIQVPFLHINHLITNKKKTNRPKDKIDVLELEKIKKIRENPNLF